MVKVLYNGQTVMIAEDFLDKYLFMLPQLEAEKCAFDKLQGFFIKIETLSKPHT